jgi:RNA recognition motif-containing protein
MQKAKKNPSIQHLAGTSKRKVKIPPPGYVCNICEASGDDRHYILNCPDRKMKKSNTTEANQEQEPSTTAKTNSTTASSTNSSSSHASTNQRKLFVSGLLFTTTKKDLVDMFGSLEQVVVANIQLLRFKDGKKCNGQAFVTTTTAEGAQKAIAALHGTHVMDTKGGKRVLKLVHAKGRNVTKKRKNGASSKNKNFKKTKILK